MGRCLEVAKARLELTLAGPPADCGALQDHLAAPPEGLVSAGSSRTQQAAPTAGGARRMRWSLITNANALRAYFRAKGEEIESLAYRARMLFCRTGAISNRH
ncbi:unnamed protein product [Parnassius apollo]|uniref:(apollo) hypothetical protein n=1 Tax=Parnassius apollo TaxID=110799 RepID=A0A8S3XFF5_PARAO|nr:unnamed protein product [Parnassius apollo]